MFINFDEKFPDFPTAPPLFYSALLMPARLFGRALLFGTLEYQEKVRGQKATGEIVKYNFPT